MSGFRISGSVIALSVCLFSGRLLTAGDWPQFLGPNRTGVSSELALISEFPPSGPKQIWQIPLGTGMSGIAVSDGLAVTMFQDESQQYVVALHADSGELKWRTAVAPAYENSMGNGPRATPTVNGAQIFVYTGEGILAALDKPSGKLQWSVDVPKSQSGTPSEYGMSCSPLVTDTLVIVHSGTDKAAVSAFDRSTGELAWTSGSGKAGYSSPMLMTLAENEQIVALTASGVASLEPVTGKTLWSFPFPTEYDCNTANPVQIDDHHLLISAGENHGSVILEITHDNGKFEVSEIWSSLGKDSQLRAEWQTPVVHQGHLYGLDNSGSAGPITNLVCIRLSDRKTVWQKSRFGKGNLILADGKLLLTTMQGELVIVKADPSEFQELGRARVMETTRQAPSLSDGRVYVRDDAHVMCFDLRDTSKAGN
jgi:outer membrane protein assembly factor BamB